MRSKKLHEFESKLENKKISKYRTQMHSLGDVLNVIRDGGREGVILSVIGRKANLSHYPTLKKCDMLTSAGLIDVEIKDRNKIFTITQKGLQFIEEFQNFQILVESLSLRY